MEIVRISAKDTFTLRQVILRPHMTVEECSFPGDYDDKTFHLGGIVDKSLVSLASFYFEKHRQIPGAYHYRLRGMATVDDYRGKGLGAALLKTAFPIIMQNQGQILWCNAREKAVGFYESVGFKPLGETFLIKEIGPHQLMFKNLES